MVKTDNFINSHPSSKNFNLKQHRTSKTYGIYVAECKFCKMQYVGETKKFFFIPGEITTANVNDDNY